jgi:uncharacterized protein (TIGR02147 family)
MAKRSRKPRKIAARATPARPDIFAYHDYRAFLKDWLELNRKGAGRVSLRALAARAGLSVAYLSMVISGARNLSEEAARLLMPALGLEERETTVFSLLKTIGDSESQEERKQALEGLQKFKGYRQRNPRETEAYRYLAHWYFVAIREMGALPGFRADPKWIQPRLRYPVPLTEIADALAFLREAGLLEILPGGSARLPDRQVECTGGVYKIALTQFHKEMYGLAAQSIDRTPRALRNLTFQTMALSAGKFEEARKILDRALAELIALGQGETDPELVYYFSLSAFPLTALPEPDEEDED